MRHQWLVSSGCALLATLGLCLSPPLLAEGPAAPAPIGIDMPAQPLGQALTELAAKTGILVGADASLVSGRQSPALFGRYTPEQALDALLAGSGLEARKTGDNIYTVRRSPIVGGPAPELPDVKVVAGSESGYVATEAVTASKTDTPLIEVPQSVSVATREQMDVQNVQNVAQALRYMAGVMPGPSQEQDTSDLIYCRGFTGNGNDEYLDGMRLMNGEFGNLRVEPYFLQSVEVLKGPASVLYGQAAPGCITNLVSKRPTADPLHEVGLQFGNYGWREATFDLGGPLAQDGQLLYRVAGLARDTDSQVDFIERERFSMAPSLTWRPSDDTSLTLLANAQHDPHGELPGYVPASGTVLPNPNGKLPVEFFSSDPDFNDIERTQTMLGYLLEHRFSGVWTVRQNFRYTNVAQNQAYLYLLGLEDDQRTLDRYSYTDDETTEAYTIDNQVQAKFETGALQHTLLFGLDYQHVRADQKTGFGFDGIPAIDLFDPVYHQPIARPDIGYSVMQHAEQTGLYFQDQAKLDRWVLLLGGREDWSHVHVDDRLFDDDAGQSDDAFTGRAGLVYLFDSGLASYLSYSTSFNPQIGTTFDGAIYKPTKGQQYEAGLKYQPKGYNAFVTLSLYHLTERNELTDDADHPGFSTQVGETRSRGIELEGHANLANGLSLIAAYTYIDAEITDSSTLTTALDGSEVPMQGKRPVLVPHTAAALWGDYTVPTGNLRGFGVGAGVRYVGSTPGDDANSLEVADYTVFDATVHYDMDALDAAFRGWRLALNATNLFNKEYVASCYNPNFCNYGELRSVIASVRYRW